MARKKTTPGLWVRIHDQIWQDDRVLDLAVRGERGLAAVSVFVMSIAWSHHARRDGDLPRGCLALIHGQKRHADLLVEVGLWEATQTGWRITRYTEWQDTAEEIGAAKDAKRRAGLASACKKNHPQPCRNPECPAVTDNVLSIRKEGTADA